MFFSKKSHVPKPLDLYEQLSSIVRTLLDKELPHHSPRHHILYTANTQLEHYREQAQLHRKRAYDGSVMSTFHQAAYEENIQRQGQLQLIIDAFMELSMHEERDMFNHRLKMKDQPIATAYNEIQNKTQFTLTPDLEHRFWQALKEQICPVLAVIAS